MTTTLPSWFTTRQQAAKARYESTPAPKRGDEPWRFSNMKKLDFEGFQRSA
jgi:Fe-S cluster assembly protein SufD